MMTLEMNKEKESTKEKKEYHLTHKPIRIFNQTLGGTKTFTGKLEQIVLFRDGKKTYQIRYLWAPP